MFRVSVLVLSFLVDWCVCSQTPIELVSAEGCITLAASSGFENSVCGTSVTPRYKPGHATGHIVADVIAPLISSDTKFVEFDAFDGMISECVSRHGSKAAASFEFKYSPCDPNQKEALCPQTFFDLTVDTVPVGDVYYLGPSSTAVTPALISHLSALLKAKGESAKAVVSFNLHDTAHDYHEQREMATWVSLRYGGVQRRVCYNESASGRPRVKGEVMTLELEVGLRAPESKVELISGEKCAWQWQRGVSGSVCPNSTHYGMSNAHGLAATHLAAHMTAGESLVELTPIGYKGGLLAECLLEKHVSVKSHMFAIGSLFILHRNKLVPSADWYFLSFGDHTQRALEALDSLMKQRRHKAMALIGLEFTPRNREVATWLSLRYSMEFEVVCRSTDDGEDGGKYLLGKLGVGKKRFPFLDVKLK